MKRRFSQVMLSPQVFLILLVLVTTGAITAQAQDEGRGATDILGGNGDITADSIEFTKDGDVVSQVIAKGNAVLTSDKMKAKCDQMTYTEATDLLIATGRPVNIEQEGVKAKCERFEYHPKSGQTILRGNPEVWQQTKDRWAYMSGEIIKINQMSDNKVKVIVEPGKKRSRMSLKELTGGGDSASETDNPATVTVVPQKKDAKVKKTAKAPATAVKIDQSNVAKIPEAAIEE